MAAESNGCGALTSPPEKLKLLLALICALTSDALGPVYVNTPLAELYENDPSPPASVAENIPLTFPESTLRVLLEAIVPPPNKPLPATIETPLCATCSSATNPERLS